MASIIPNPLFIPLFSIEEVILNKDTGLPLTAGVVKFYRDSQRGTQKPVYKITGTAPNYTFVSVGNELTLGIAGDFVDQNGDPFVPYAYPYDADGALDLYYITVESSGGVAQFTREAVPYIGQENINPEDRISTANEISNPQFVEINFPTSGTFTIDVTGANTVTKIAPDWDLITSGTGSITLEREQPTAQNIQTNPPYSLRITAPSTLGATVQLRQRFKNTPSIGRGQYASGFVLAKVIGGGNSSLSMQYAPSTGTATSIIPNTAIPTDGDYHPIANNALIPQQANTAANTGYVDIIITIPTNRTIVLTSIQVVFVATSINIPYDEQTSGRQKDQLFHYYENSLVQQPKQNILTGWNFSVNPWQFVNPVQTTVASQTQYIADQTILHQETAGALTSGKGGAGINFGLQLFAINGVNANRFALIQYVDSETMKSYWNQIVSALVRSALFTSNATQTNLKMRLIYRTTGDAIPTISNTEPITGWDANGDLTFAAGWSSVEPINDIAYQLQTKSVGQTANEMPAYAFNQFQLPSAVSNAMYLGVVVYITAPLNNSLGSEDAVVFDRISLVQNEFALDCACETWDESLRKCQYYYEQSYTNATGIGTATNDGARFFLTPLGGDYSSSTLYKGSVDLRYKQVKRSSLTLSSNLKIYSIDGTLNNIWVRAWTGASALIGPGNVGVTGNWAVVSSNRDGIMFEPSNVTGLGTFAGAPSSAQGQMFFHYIADARLGI